MSQKSDRQRLEYTGARLSVPGLRSLGHYRYLTAQPGLPPHVHRDEVFSTWRQHIRELARFPNLSVKLGGLGMPYTGWYYHLELRSARAGAEQDPEERDAEFSHFL